jgi:RNA polymerase sigma factor (sigma-70 family)
VGDGWVWRNPGASGRRITLSEREVRRTVRAANVNAVITIPALSSLTDEQLIARLATGHQEALAPLYERYARVIFTVATQWLDRPAAEEIVQDVFLAVWRKADSFDAEQGSFRPWLLQLTHWRIINELRRRSRRPRLDPELGADDIAQLFTTESEPEDVLAREERREALRRAVASLPPVQQQALGLAFFNELTHKQVAATLEVPLGTAKTRIRTGIRNLRTMLAPVAAALVLLLGLGTLAVRDLMQRMAFERDERALTLLTSSELVDRRLTPAASGLPAEAHGHYRARDGVSTVVLSVTSLSAAPAGQVYAGWALIGDRWLPLGTVAPDANGTGRVIAESPDLARPPDLVEITLQSTPGGESPSGRPILAWRSS